MNIPRFVITAAASGQGKTIVITGTVATLTARGVTVQSFKVGPDPINPGYYTLASEQMGRNLDPFLMGERRVASLLVHSARETEIPMIEGVMGLFDGQFSTHGFGSTTHVAALADAPIVLYLDASRALRSVAAVALGLTQYDPALNFAGVIINKVASPRYREEVLFALEGVGLLVLGALPCDVTIEAPSRHLGLVPVEGQADANATMERLASQTSTHIDLDALIATAWSAPELGVTVWNPAVEVIPPSGCRPVVAATGGRTFIFRYPETVGLLEAMGCRVQVSSPAVDDRLPKNTVGIYLGGRLPEVHVAALASRTDLRREITGSVVFGGPVAAECAGMLYLSGNVDATGMVGVIPGIAAMGPCLALGYRGTTTTRNGFYVRAGEEVTGHEFHRTMTQFPPGSESGWE